VARRSAGGPLRERAIREIIRVRSSGDGEDSRSA
jgi:hypothetical protein